jgi:hypothetical protein
MAGDASGLEPWWIGIGVGVVSALAGVIGKLWSEQKSTVTGLRADLAAANAHILELQKEANERSDKHQLEHRRDLRRLAGISTSVDPPPLSPWPPVVIREAPTKPRRAPRKS